MADKASDLTTYQVLGGMAVLICIMGIIFFYISPHYAILVFGFGVLVMISGIYFMLADIHETITKKN